VPVFCFTAANDGVASRSFFFRGVICVTS
jgi:hypothetical protein